jgi:hypothetical protein
MKCDYGNYDIETNNVKYKKFEENDNLATEASRHKI